MPEQRFIEQAELVVWNWCVANGIDYPYRKTLAECVAQALSAAATAPAGNVIDDKGVVRRVLGTLPVTADGCVIGQHADVWFTDDDGVIRNAEVTPPVADSGESSYFLYGHDCYSTRESAEQSARAAEKRDE